MAFSKYLLQMVTLTWVEMTWTKRLIDWLVAEFKEENGGIDLQYRSDVSTTS